ncbi:heavy-metal-associated domain-containing protein [Neobacillus vireti]|uniref:heavy-metal-associated domain-containing protein n=1 Tax=Neobacillus vireti TaxID=220686 RepID=UPI002FFF7137
MNQVTLYVPGICCMNVNHSIEQEIKALNGIISYKGTLPKGKIVIEYTHRLISSQEITDIIKERGFSIVKKIQREKTVDIYN